MLKSVTLGLVITSLSVLATAQEHIEGEMIEKVGRYYVKNDLSMTELNVVNSEYLRVYAGQNVRVEGEMLDSSIDAHIVRVQLADGEKVIYNWDTLNQNNYEN